MPCRYVFPSRPPRQDLNKLVLFGDSVPRRGCAEQPRAGRREEANPGLRNQAPPTLKGLCRPSTTNAACMLLNPLHNPFRVARFHLARTPGLADTVGQPWAALHNAFSVENPFHQSNASQSRGGERGAVRSTDSALFSVSRSASSLGSAPFRRGGLSLLCSFANGLPERLFR